MEVSQINRAFGPGILEQALTGLEIGSGRPVQGPNVIRIAINVCLLSSGRPFGAHFRQACAQQSIPGPYRGVKHPSAVWADAQLRHWGSAR